MPAKSGSDQTDLLGMLTLAGQHTGPRSGASPDVAIEDWNLLFCAVLDRLTASYDDQQPVAPAPQASAESNRIRTVLHECLQPLEQLRASIVHELERREHLELDLLAAPSALARCLSSRASPTTTELVPRLSSARYAAATRARSS